MFGTEHKQILILKHTLRCKVERSRWTVNQQPRKSELLFAETIQIQQQLWSVGLKMKAQLEWQSADEHVTVSAIVYLSRGETGRVSCKQWSKSHTFGAEVRKWFS